MSVQDRLHAADQLARLLFDLDHTHDCSVPSGDICRRCKDKRPEDCLCTCGMCEIWRLALVIRPQGSGDPQP